MDEAEPVIGPESAIPVDELLALYEAVGWSAYADSPGLRDPTDPGATDRPGPVMSRNDLATHPPLGSDAMCPSSGCLLATVPLAPAHAKLINLSDCECPLCGGIDTVAINRRTFLHAAGLGAAAAALAGCSGTQTTSPLRRRLSGTAGTTHARIDFPALARKLSGSLITPEQSGYDLARRSFNPLFDNRTPAAVAQCRRIEDVQACVSAAAAAGAPIAARSGGHSYAGYSTPDGALIVDLSGMSSVEVNAGGTAVIGAGARLIDVYTALAGACRSARAPRSALLVSRSAVGSACCPANTG